MKYGCTGVILAGGQSKRFSGRNKALLLVGGEPILDRIYRLFDELFEEVILVTNDPLAYLPWDVTIVTDLYDTRSSLTGIHAGLFYARMPYAFFSACDTPFLQKNLVCHILDAIEPRLDVIVPQTTAGLEPLCAVYSKRCLASIAHNLDIKQFKILEFYRKVRTKRIGEHALRRWDPELTSFFNVNSPRDLPEAERIGSHPRSRHEGTASH